MIGLDEVDEEDCAFVTSSPCFAAVNLDVGDEEGVDDDLQAERDGFKDICGMTL